MGCLLSVSAERETCTSRHENWQTTSDVCAAVTVVYVVVKTVRITQAGVSIPQTTAWANQKIFLNAVTIFMVAQKIV